MNISRLRWAAAVPFIQLLDLALDSLTFPNRDFAKAAQAFMTTMVVGIIIAAVTPVTPVVSPLPSVEAS